MLLRGERIIARAMTPDENQTKSPGNITANSPKNMPPAMMVITVSKSMVCRHAVRDRRVGQGTVEETELDWDVNRDVNEPVRDWRVCRDVNWDVNEAGMADAGINDAGVHEAGMNEAGTNEVGTKGRIKGVRGERCWD